MAPENRTRSWLKGAALVGVGAVAALGVSRIHVSFDGEKAQAAPPATMPAALATSSSAVADAKNVSRAFAQVAEQMKPAVVSIVVEKGGRSRGPARGRPQQGNPFRGSPFERFFGGPGGGGGDDDGPGFGGGKQVGAGSGFVIDSRGYIVTNNHVVEGADVIKVRFSDGRELKATIKGTDPKTDLAVIKVDGKDLPASRWGDADKLQPGEWVVAVGNPYGLDHTVTVGVISAKGRYNVGDGPYEDYLQTDAAINPGNSGGPLVNLDGEVVGINTAIRGIGTMIGFAIPSSMAKGVVAQLIAEGHVRRPYVGIYMQDVTPELASSLGAGAPSKGAIVGRVESGSPAHSAGLLEGDVITRVDGQPVDGSKAVQRVVLTKNLGQKVAFDVWRNGKGLQLAAVTAAHPGDKEDKQSADAPEGGEGGKARLGLDLQTLSPDLAQRLGLDPKAKGAVVAGVREDGPAAEAGLREGDVIVEVDRQPVASADDAVRLLRGKRQGGHLLRVRRGDGAFFIPLNN